MRAHHDMHLKLPHRHNHPPPPATTVPNCQGRIPPIPPDLSSSYQIQSQHDSMKPLQIRLARYLPTISTLAIRAHLQSPAVPLHLGKHLTSSWEAFARWRMDDGLQRLREDVGEDRVVEVELGKKGRGYLDPETRRVSVGFGTSCEICPGVAR